MNFPEDIHLVLKGLAYEYKMKLLSETHFEANNRELVWFNNNELHRLDFDFSDPAESLRLTYYIDKFPVFPKALIWCHNYIPTFPYLAKIMWYKLPGISLGLKKADYKLIIKEYLDKILSGIVCKEKDGKTKEGGIYGI